MHLGASGGPAARWTREMYLLNRYFMSDLYERAAVHLPRNTKIIDTYIDCFFYELIYFGRAR